MAKELIRLRNLCMAFDDEQVLNNLNLYINDKEFLTLLGPSGCGKTTTLRIIGGFTTPTSGDVLFDGVRINAVPPYQRQINTVFQKYALFPHLNVFENIAFGLRMKKIPDPADPSGKRMVKLDEKEIERRVSEMLEIISLKGFEHRKPDALSGGQQQRVAIARALVTGPAIICKDEPLSNLDAKLRVQLRNELKKMQKEFGITTIYVTHDQEEALTLSDRIAVFNKGVIEQIGTPNEVYNFAKTEFVCNFIGDVNRLSDELVKQMIAAGAKLSAAEHNYIRLERLHVNVPAREGELTLPGVVESREYYGLYIKYYINTGSQTLKVIEKNDGVNIYEAGQKVNIVINPADVMAYPATEEAEVRG